MVASPPTPQLAEALRELRRQLVALLQIGYGRALFRVDEAGAPQHEETVITVPRRDDEGLDAFVVRVWTNHKVLPHAAIEFSATSGRLTARITVRADGEEADLGAQIAQLRQQVGALAAHLAEEEAGD